jgi:hypothetical protein
VGYNSGYYLPFGGGFMGPRFLMTMIPFLALPTGIALKRYPGPTIALAGASLTAMIIATITHPLIGYETEAIVWVRDLHQQGPTGNVFALFQPTIASAFGLGRGWGAIWPFFLAAGGAVLLTTLATARTRISRASLMAGVLALAGWCVFAALAPTVLGIDHRGLLSIVGAGDKTALHKGFGDYPLRTLAPLAAAAGLIGLLSAYLFSRGSSRREAAYTRQHSPAAAGSSGR